MILTSMFSSFKLQLLTCSRRRNGASAVLLLLMLAVGRRAATVAFSTNPPIGWSSLKVPIRPRARCPFRGPDAHHDLIHSSPWRFLRRPTGRISSSSTARGRDLADGRPPPKSPQQPLASEPRDPAEALESAVASSPPTDDGPQETASLTIKGSSGHVNGKTITESPTENIHRPQPALDTTNAPVADKPMSSLWQKTLPKFKITTRAMAKMTRADPQISRFIKMSSSSSPPSITLPDLLTGSFVSNLWKGMTLPFPSLRRMSDPTLPLLLNQVRATSSSNATTTSSSSALEVGLTFREGLMALSLYWALGVLAYSVVLEKWSVIDALYFTTVCLSTVGYGDLCPSHTASRWFAALFGCMGMALLGAAVASVGARLVQAEMGAWKRAQQESRQRLMQLFEGMPSIIGPLRQQQLQLQRRRRRRQRRKLKEQQLRRQQLLQQLQGEQEQLELTPDKQQKQTTEVGSVVEADIEEDDDEDDEDDDEDDDDEGDSDDDEELDDENQNRASGLSSASLMADGMYVLEPWPAARTHPLAAGRHKDLRTGTSAASTSVAPNQRSVGRPRIKWWILARSVLLRVWPSCLLILAGGAVVRFLNGNTWTWSETFYYALMTASTIGLGDYSPQTRSARLFSVIFIPLSVAAAGELLSSVALALVQRRQRLLYKKQLENDLTLEHLQMMDTDDDGKITREEYVQFMLFEMGRVTKSELDELYRQFDRLDVSQSGFLDNEDLILMAQLRGATVKNERRR